MNNTELSALTALVDADRLTMQATNADRKRHGFAMAYDDAVAWPARDALEAELTRRDIVTPVNNTDTLYHPKVT